VIEKRSSIVVGLILFASVCLAEETSNFNIVELPRPNSGTFSTTEAEKRKPEIFSNHPTDFLRKWVHPTAGFSVHLNKDDTVTIYNHWMRKLAEVQEFKDSPKATKFFSDLELRRDQSLEDLKLALSMLPLFGNQASILITSDQSLTGSKRIHEILEALFIPTVQIFYAQAEP